MSYSLFKTTAFTLFFLAITVQYSCSNKKRGSKEFVEPISADKTNQTSIEKTTQTSPEKPPRIENMERQPEIVFPRSESDLLAIKEMIDSISTLNNSAEGSKNVDTLSGSEANIVNLRTVVGELFDPQSQPCPLPEKISKQLNKLKANGKMWIPAFIESHIKQMPENVLYVPRQSISNVLHWVTIKKAGSKTSTTALIYNSPTYTDLDIETYMLGGYSSFFYSLDCSGYLNAAIEASATVPGADITTAAKSSLEAQNSIFIGGGIILSPLYAAYYDNLVPIDTLTRIRILTAMAFIPGTSDKDTIDMDYSFDALWASKTGSSSFNGKAEFGTKGRGGIGIAQISASAGGGGEVSRQCKFTNFNTYISKRNPVEKPAEKITIAKIKAKLRSIQAKHSGT